LPQVTTQKRLLFIITLIGGIFSIGFPVTHGLRYYLILTKCNSSNNISISIKFYSELEEWTYVVVDFARFCTFIFFLYEARKFYMSTDIGTVRMPSKKTRCLFIFLAVLALVLAVSIAALSCMRDLIILDYCTSEQLSVIIFHTIFKVIVLLTTVVVSFSATYVLNNAKLKWDKELDRCKWKKDIL
jgi:hypothetical protein